MGRATAEGVMQRDLVERARKGDHDAFAELAGAAISRLDATAWLMLRDADRARTPSRTPSSVPGAICPRCATRTASTPGSTGCSSAPASMRPPGPPPSRRRRHDRPLRPARHRRRRRRRSPIATSSSVASAGSEPESGRSSSCITTSTCRCRKSRRRSGSRWGPRSHGCTAALREMRAALDADDRDRTRHP